MNPMTVGSHAATIYSAGTAGFGAALAVVAAWGVGAAGYVMPADVIVALGVVLTGGTSFMLRFIPQPKETPHA